MLGGGGEDGRGRPSRPAPSRAERGCGNHDAARPSSPASTSATATRSNWSASRSPSRVEGPRARTVVDHIFRNPLDRQLEGTFEYPLPTGASPCYFAMFLGHTRRRRARAPLRGRNAAGAASEASGPAGAPTSWSSTSTPPTGAAPGGPHRRQGEGPRGLRGSRPRPSRPGAARVRRRQHLQRPGLPHPRQGLQPRPPRLRGDFCRSPASRCSTASRCRTASSTRCSFSLQADAADCKHDRRSCRPTRRTRGRRPASATRTTWRTPSPAAKSAFACTPADPMVQAISGRQGDNGPLYLYARLRPELKGGQGRAVRQATPCSCWTPPQRAARPLRRQHEAAAGRPRRRRGHQALQRPALQRRRRWVEPKGWIANTTAGRETALAKPRRPRARRRHRLSAALDRLVAARLRHRRGHAAERASCSPTGTSPGASGRRPAGGPLRERCPYPTRFHCYRTGLGAENAELFDALTRKGGGVFQCFGEADLDAAARPTAASACRSSSVRFVGGADGQRHAHRRRARTAVYPGGELVVAAKLPRPAAATVVVEGLFEGRSSSQTFAVESGRGSELAARGWGEVAVASLLALNDP